VCPTGSIFWTCLNQQICKTKPPVEKTLHWRFFFDAFCTIRNASFLEIFRCQTHPASIGFIDMPLDFKSSMPVRETCMRDDFRCANAKNYPAFRSDG
jgi:hypothetical protein